MLFSELPELLKYKADSRSFTEEVLVPRLNKVLLGGAETIGEEERRFLESLKRLILKCTDIDFRNRPSAAECLQEYVDGCVGRRSEVDILKNLNVLMLHPLFQYPDMKVAFLR